MKNILLLIIALSSCIWVGSAQEDKREDQATNKKPCSAAEASQFDFWVGEWDLTWGEDSKGSNIIEKTMGDCVIQENFDGTPGYADYFGKSLSVYNPKKKEWNQTWVDNQGAYLDFTGKMEGDEMILSRTTVEGWTQTMFRMVFHNIAENSLDWRWEKSLDQGKTWELKWAIHYERKSPGK